MITAEQRIQDVIERTAALALFQIKKDCMRVMAELNLDISWSIRSIGQKRRFENSQKIKK